MEQHKLTISPNGQITLPRKLRQELSIDNYVCMKLVHGKVVLEPFVFGDGSKDIVKEVRNEGFAGEDFTGEIEENNRVLPPVVKFDLTWENDDDQSITIPCWHRKK